MFVNWDLLKSCGVTELPKTWSEFLDVSDAIAKEGHYPFALNLSTSSPSGIQNVYMGYAWASDITMKDDSGNYAVAGNKDMIEFAEFYKDVYERGYLLPGMSALTEADMTSKFIGGEIGFIINSMAVLQAWREDNPNMEIGAARVPVRDGYNGKSGMCVASWAVGVTESSEHKDEAMQFIEYLFNGLNGDVNAGLAETQSAFPGSALAEPDYSSSDEVFRDVYGMFAEGFPINEFIGMKKANVIMVDFINALIPYMEGDVSVDDYLEDVQEAIDKVYND
jgi:multiple sugar transport system substrate-binding protein